MEFYYFLDRSILQPQRMANMALRVQPAVKDRAHNPLFREDFFADPPRRWEVRYDNSYPNVLYDPRDGVYRCYYTVCSKDRDSAAADRAERARRDYRPSPTRVVSLAYAESKDGVHWVKPALGLVEFEGSTANNLLFRYAHGTGVFLDEADPDPARRYKLVTKVDYPGGRSFMAVNFSADGIHWGDMIPWPRGNPPADSHNFPFRDKGDGLYKVITRTWRDGVRICSLCASPDFLNWSEPREILRGEGFGAQVYSMPVFQSGGLYLGLASIFHEGDRTAPDFDLVDCELTWAYSTDHFNRAAPGQPAIPRGRGAYPDGEFDCGCLYAAAPFEKDGRVWVYYMGGNGRHTNFRETSFARAWWEKDRYACLQPRDPERPGEVWAGLFTAVGDRLEILADTLPGGHWAAALYGADRRPLAGFGFEDCRLAAGQDGWTAVDFRGGPLTGLETTPVSLVLRCEKACFYALRGGLTLLKNRGYDGS